ncbi:MAG: 5-formyltetrahydrofolate cyclo-ligase [Clostridia bacterium]|nr:5-formyltetrahydrofolate cyclo-ligase [Clostridia bacterium]
MDKKALRREIGAKKSALSAEEVGRRSAILAEKLFEAEQYRDCRSLYAYLSFNEEVRTDPIIERAWADGKRVAVPKVVGKEMVFIWIDSFDALGPGYYGITEPVNDGPVADDQTALVLMPGLAFDPEGHRVGYGGGFYDRFLENEPDHPLVALCYDFQMYDHLDVESHDVPVDLVITDT